MKKHFYTTLLLALIISQAVIAQKHIWKSPAAYLGQKPPADTPQIFARELLTKRDTFPLDRVAFSDDGKEFYYPSNTTWFDSKNSKLRYFKYDGQKWTALLF